MAYFKTANEKGKYRDDHSREDVIAYILNPMKTRYYAKYNIDETNPTENMHQVAIHYGKEQGVQLRHFVVSFDPIELTDPTIANIIAGKLASFFIPEYQTVYAVHEDKPYLHIHIVINSISYVDGHRYRGTRAEFYAMRKSWGYILHQYGIELKYLPHGK